LSQAAIGRIGGEGMMLVTERAVNRAMRQ
jgi:hypothetical protein